MPYFVSSPIYADHITGPGHPEQPARTLVIDRSLEIAGIKNPANTLKPRIAEEAEILLCHTKPYYDLVCEEIAVLVPGIVSTLSTGDVQISSDSLEAALLAAGGVLVGIDHVMNHSASNVFCSTRPPGHHACSDQGMGFCIFNNIAIGARYAQRKYGISRVLIADWDVHHGNGTQEIFYRDPSVFYFSTHEDGLYPFTGTVEEKGAGPGIGVNLNCPIKAGPQSRLEVLKAFNIQLREQMEKFKPELVLISAGFDAHAHDPLGHFNLTEQDFMDLTISLKKIADEYAQGRLVSVLEGGYHLPALALSAVAHAQALS